VRRIEAIVLLAVSTLANRLAAQGVDIELTAADRAALEGFNQVWLYEDGWWLGDPDIHRQAGLGRDDIGALTFMLSRVQDEKMRWQHASGEQLD
jgi:hypothetical protein